MKLSAEKMNFLAGKLVDLFLNDDDIEYYVSEIDLRRAVVRALSDEMKRDEAREEKARQKVRNIRRGIPENSAEFETLSQQFYREFLDKGL